MTPTEVTTILRQYREWLCDTPKSVRPHTRQINEAIDAAVEMINRLEAAEKERDELEERCAVLTDELRLAVRQNSRDRLMTAEELRSCEATLGETK